MRATKGSAAATAAPTSLSGDEGRGNVAAAIFSRAIALELKEECAWRGLAVSGIKRDLIQRLRCKDIERTWTDQDGFLAAAWVERVCGVKAPLRTFRSDETLALWVWKQLTARRY